MGWASMGWLAACVAPSSPPPSPPPPAVVARYQCDRCHDATPVFAAAVPERSCVGCHQQILRGEHDLRFLPSDTARWKAHLHRLNEAPSLVALSSRMTRAAFLALLRDPVDRRPNLPATMPRFAFAAGDDVALADVFGLVDPSVEVPVGDVDRGLASIGERCAPCHDALPLAPALASIRDRGWPAAVEAWLQGPSHVVPGTAMPDPALAPDLRRDIVAALFSGRIRPPSPPHVPDRPPLPARPVTFAEVDAAVFHEVCRHCHADPAPVGGDGGPGNTGGLGFPGAGLDLSTRAAVLRGGRHDVLAPMPDGTPRLVAHLWARHAEAAGRPVEGVLGMPLGLPPLPPASIALVEAWIRQGAGP